ncbi:MULTISPECIES: DUF502 domain-containing protein [Dehalococcoides]|jgi:uncharacterized membrane protein|uniref:Transporter n=2 Tax=Dehalococcoides mccartyi TaxID=61435 RepID=A0A142VAT8_9CHLR|nr:MULTISPECIES: DUF502 domain-containing protein [Dehalococcoides]AGG06760.1 hypothetical protein dcmb_1160 [Dehalococcoides mccartyi DCMB5]AII61258.1 hypothetical protein X794_05475 [Dehalococcoides mccartyi CG5]AMU86954.1 hypothetical protein Dm11a5_1128 [Dehalococcoides mccartyi]AOV99741.1 transporter [Dehalococcoides mccartyi]AQX74972.1 hypothetical protein B1776_05365 [Dehalococcoides mccartyi]
MPENQNIWTSILKYLRSRFLAGILIVVPVGASILVLIWLFQSIDNILQPVVSGIFGQEIVGLGVAFTILLVLIVGIILSNYLGHRVVKTFENLAYRLPIFGQIQKGVKQVLESVSGLKKASFREVVILEFPKPGLKAMGFITNRVVNKEDGQEYNLVFIPNVPNPTSGYLELVPDEKLMRTDIPVEVAIKMLISSGIVAPESFVAKKAPEETAFL